MSNEKALIPEVKVRNLSDAEVVAGLNAIHDDVQRKFHDQWDWTKAKFLTDCLESRIAALTAERDALKYQATEWAGIAGTNAGEIDALKAESKQHKLETAIALEFLTRIATPDQIHNATSAILAARSTPPQDVEKAPQS